MELTDCIGDDSNVYLWVDVTAPEGTALTPPEGGWISSSFQAELPEDVSAAMMTSLTALPDEDAGDNRISFCIMINAVSLYSMKEARSPRPSGTTSGCLRM